MTFKDVAVDITQEDWELMRPVQKELYKTVTLQNYWNMVSLGKDHLYPSSSQPVPPGLFLTPVVKNGLALRHAWLKMGSRNKCSYLIQAQE